MGSRYAFIVLYVLLERHLSRGDYVRRDARPGVGAGFERGVSAGVQPGAEEFDTKREYERS
jgi:hypothetical protein